jgi:hypothetical protein
MDGGSVAFSQAKSIPSDGLSGLIGWLKRTRMLANADLVIDEF